MSTWLCLDTCSSQKAIAIASDDDQIHHVFAEAHVAIDSLLAQVDSMLASLDITRTDIAHLACVCGPGSYTGVRTSAACLNAWVTVNPRPVFNVNALWLDAVHANVKRGVVIHHGFGTHFYLATLDWKEGKLCLKNMMRCEKHEIEKHIVEGEIIYRGNLAMFPDNISISTQMQGSPIHVLAACVGEMIADNILPDQEALPVYLSDASFWDRSS